MANPFCPAVYHLVVNKLDDLLQYWRRDLREVYLSRRCLSETACHKKKEWELSSRPFTRELETVWRQRRHESFSSELASTASMNVLESHGGASTASPPNYSTGLCSAPWTLILQRFGCVLKEEATVEKTKKGNHFPGFMWQIPTALLTHGSGRK